MEKLPVYPAPFFSEKKCGVYKTEGIILKITDHGDLDKLLTVYTKQLGKILARAISAKKKESKLKSFLTPLTYSQFLLAKSRTIDIVTDVQPIENFTFLHQNLERLALAFYFSELIDKTVVAPEPDENLWRLTLGAFKVLNNQKYELKKIKEAFEARLLEVLGYGQVGERKPIEFIQGLVGEEIKSISFLRELNLTS